MKEPVWEMTTYPIADRFAGVLTYGRKVRLTVRWTYTRAWSARRGLRRVGERCCKGTIREVSR